MSAQPKPDLSQLDRATLRMSIKTLEARAAAVGVYGKVEVSARFALVLAGFLKRLETK